MKVKCTAIQIYKERKSWDGFEKEWKLDILRYRHMSEYCIRFYIKISYDLYYWNVYIFAFTHDMPVLFMSFVMLHWNLFYLMKSCLTNLDMKICNIVWNFKLVLNFGLCILQWHNAFIHVYYLIRHGYSSSTTRRHRNKKCWCKVFLW